MVVEQFLMGGDRNFGYLVGDDKTGKALVVDPAYTPERIVDFAREKGLTIEYVFNTHRHHDHSNGNAVMEKLTGIRALAFGDIDPVTGREVADGAVFPLGSLEARIIHTPGHTEDSICILVGDALFTGDTLFVGKVGGTGFGEDARREYESIHNKLMTLPGKTRVFPGHNVGIAPHSTIDNERKTNPFLLRPDFESFVELKQNWLEYKREHGIA
ncbi:MAG TPA: MBL fold metallo-hydrolase [Bacteroidetes bacterium]|nr:MBL fold metallo-hydrolase [Bacteroidota bacterium]